MTPTSLRTHMCGDLRESDIGQRVSLCGWVGRRRDHGEHLAFVDLRDHTGITQCVIDNGADVRSEYVVRITGVVRARPEGTVNDGLAGLSVTDELRAAGFSADRAFDGRSMKSQMKAADRSGATFAVIIGGDEAAAGTCTVRNLSTSEQSTIPRTGLVAHLAAALGPRTPRRSPQ